ncbi:unnamed protein product [Calypogeia fissa]
MITHFDSIVFAEVCETVETVLFRTQFLGQWGKRSLTLIRSIVCQTDRLRIAEPLRCTFLKNVSHRGKSAELWIQSREKRPVLDNWDRKQWSTIHKRLDFRANSSAWDVFQSEANQDEFMSWTFQNARSQTSSRRFTIAPVEKPWWRADGSQVLTSFATEDLKQGETALHQPVRCFLSNIWERGIQHRCTLMVLHWKSSWLQSFYGKGTCFSCFVLFFIKGT